MLDYISEAIHNNAQKGIVQEKYEHTTLDTLIEQDVEHGTFRAQNCFDEEYLTPMFYKYAKSVEQRLEDIHEMICEMIKDADTTKDPTIRMYLIELLRKYGQEV